MPSLLEPLPVHDEPAPGASYPSELVETAVWNGEAIVLRPIRAEDEAQHREFVDRLDLEDQRLRFFFARQAVPEIELARMTHIDYAREMAFIAERTRVDGTKETIGVARGVIDADNVDAELGIIVRSDLKARGLGQMLLGKLIDFLAGRGTGRLVAFVLAENRPMRQLAEANGFVPDDAASDSQALCLVLDLASRHPVAVPEGPALVVPTPA